MPRKNTVIKDAAILFAITLVAGLCLGFVYNLTKDPIDQQKMASKMGAYQAVFPEAEKFSYDDSVVRLVEDSEALLSASPVPLGKVSVDEVVDAVTGSGELIGRVVVASSNSGYNGNITVSVGIALDGTVTGVEMIELNETVGLGMNAADESFKGQYKDKNVESFQVVKGGTSADNEIDALSGATITSDAVTEAVNAALYFANNCIPQ